MLSYIEWIAPSRQKVRKQSQLNTHCSVVWGLFTGYQLFTQVKTTYACDRGLKAVSLQTLSPETIQQRRSQSWHNRNSDVACPPYRSTGHFLYVHKDDWKKCWLVSQHGGDFQSVFSWRNYTDAIAAVFNVGSKDIVSTRKNSVKIKHGWYAV